MGYKILQFGAKWCGPCKNVKPFVTSMKSVYTNVEFVYINIDIDEDITDLYNVKNLPTFILLVDNKELDRFEGSSNEKLIALLELTC
jgi:thioredoxin 1